MVTPTPLKAISTPSHAVFTADARDAFVSAFNQWCEKGKTDAEDLFARFERNLIVMMNNRKSPVES